MKISRFLPETTIDYPGKLACVIFVPGCNLACPACHGRQVVYGEEKISEQEIFSYLLSRKGWIDGLVISGGEPILQSDLEDFCRKAKNYGFVKLDSNGSNPDVLEKLLKEKLIDYLALDVKGPPQIYSSITGKEIDLSRIEESIKLANNFPNYEFRTTIVPVLRDGSGKLEFMTLKEIEEMASWVSGYARKESLWYLQPFIARGKEEMMDERFSAENLNEKMRETPRSLLEKMQEAMKKYFPNCRIR